MSWQEMIEMRALKEELICESSIQLTPDLYCDTVERALRVLKDSERQAIFLRFWEGLSIARIADRMSLSWNGADQLIDRALHLLRLEIQHQKILKLTEENL